MDDISVKTLHSSNHCRIMLRLAWATSVYAMLGPEDQETLHSILLGMRQTLAIPLVIREVGASHVVIDAMVDASLAASRLVNALKGVTSRRLRAASAAVWTKSDAVGGKVWSARYAAVSIDAGSDSQITQFLAAYDIEWHPPHG